MPIAAKLDELGKAGLDRADGPGFIVCWPLGLAILAFTDMERTNGLLEDGGGMSRWQQRSGSRCTAPGPGGSRSRVERQPRLRRIPHRDAAAARRGAAGIPRLPRPAALRQGQDRVRPVHGRAPQPPDSGQPAAELILRSRCRREPSAASPRRRLDCFASCDSHSARRDSPGNRPLTQITLARAVMHSALRPSLAKFRGIFCRRPVVDGGSHREISGLRRNASMRRRADCLWSGDGAADRSRPVRSCSKGRDP